MEVVRSALRTAVVALALVATVLVPCLCVAMPASAPSRHGCCAGETGLLPAAPDCCACAVTPVSDSATAPAGAHPSLSAAAVSAGPWSSPAPALPAASIVEHVPTSPPPLRV
jgi:hypothetical protein